VAGLRTKLLLCVDEQLARPPEAARARPDGPHLARPPRSDGARVLAAVREALRDLAPESSVCARGAAGPGFALPDALAALEQGLHAVVLGGVHTDHAPAIIGALDARERLYRNDNLDSIIPGEAAAFVVLMRPQVARSRGLREHAAFCSVAGALEKATPDNDES